MTDFLVAECAIRQLHARYIDAKGRRGLCGSLRRRRRMEGRRDAHARPGSDQEQFAKLMSHSERPLMILARRSWRLAAVSLPADLTSPRTTNLPMAGRQARLESITSALSMGVTAGTFSGTTGIFTTAVRPTSRPLFITAWNAGLRPECPECPGTTIQRLCARTFFPRRATVRLRQGLRRACRSSATQEPSHWRAPCYRGGATSRSAGALQAINRGSKWAGRTSHASGLICSGELDFPKGLPKIQAC